MRRKVPVRPVANCEEIALNFVVTFEWNGLNVESASCHFVAVFSLSFNDLLAIDELAHRPWMCVVTHGSGQSHTFYSLQFLVWFFLLCSLLFGSIVGQNSNADTKRPKIRLSLSWAGIFSRCKLKCGHFADIMERNRFLFFLSLSLSFSRRFFSSRIFKP